MGPTLASWLARARPCIHEAIVDGDRDAVARLGHGNAIAQPYHHVILPLASRREKRTEVRWGLLDFERRFGRTADGMWLPETAVDRETLEVLAGEGIAFTVLAPHQVSAPPAGGVGRIALGGGREIAVFVYDGELSHGVAFGALLEDDARWLERIQREADAGRPRVTIATDGETFGHHHPGAERTLAGVVDGIVRNPELTLENFGSMLAAASELEELELVAETSWSCVHGIERWRSGCGCRMAPEIASQQAWRAPLREALERLGSALAERVCALAGDALRDPEEAIDGLGRVMGGAPDDLARYAEESASAPEAVRDARALLEIVRDAAAMFTSCGWFFDDIAGLEPVQVLRYAAHALDRLATLEPETAERLESGLVEDLARAPSNDPEIVDGARLWSERIRA